MTQIKGGKLEFFIDTNPYFKNFVLNKTYHMIDDELTMSWRKPLGINVVFAWLIYLFNLFIKIIHAKQKLY